MTFQYCQRVHCFGAPHCMVSMAANNTNRSLSLFRPSHGVTELYSTVLDQMRSFTSVSGAKILSILLWSMQQNEQQFISSYQTAVANNECLSPSPSLVQIVILLCCVKCYCKVGLIMCTVIYDEIISYLFSPWTRWLDKWFKIDVVVHNQLLTRTINRPPIL